MDRSAALALIAHDLKNALGDLETQLSQLIDDPAPVMAQRAHLHCTDLRRQFVQFLTLYSAGQEGLRVLCEDESPSELLQALLRQWTLKLQLGDHPISIHIRPSSPPPFWYFDRRLVQLALDSAIHNATRFANSQVWIGVQEQDGQLCWTVDDDGAGLGAEDPGQESATGLGHALAEAVALAHRHADRRGSATLGTGPAGGVRFTLQLP
jgi:signal transduction histidine kinase